MINTITLLVAAALTVCHSFVKSLVTGKDFIVVLTSALFFISGFFGIAGGVILLIGIRTVSDFLPQAVTLEITRINTPSLGLIVLAIALATLVTSVGIWRGMRWGRHGAIIISATALGYSMFTFSLVAIGDIIFYALMILLVATNWKKLRAASGARDKRSA